MPLPDHVPAVDDPLPEPPPNPADPPPPPTVPGAAASEAPPPMTPAAPPAPPAQTRWTPFDREAARTADGSLDVCSTLVFPLTFIPGIGDVVGTVGDWICIIPAAIAVDYTGAFHGGHESHVWQPALALVLKKAFETVLDTPIVVVTIGVLVGGVVGAVALAVYADVPVTLLSAGVVGITLIGHLALKGARDGIGDFIFQVVYGALTPEVEGEELVKVQQSSALQPGVKGIPAGFGMIATVAGSKPLFDWKYAVPVVGPVWRGEAHAQNIQLRVRRYAREVLLVEKADLSTMDATSEVLGTTQGYAYAAAHVSLGAAVTLFGAGLAVSFSDDPERNEYAGTAETLGGVGLGFAVLGGVAVVVGLTADRLQPVLIPLAWGAAE